MTEHDDAHNDEHDNERLDLEMFIPADMDARAERVIARVGRSVASRESVVTLIARWSAPLVAAAAMILVVSAALGIASRGTVAQESAIVPDAANALGVDPAMAAWASQRTPPSAAEVISALSTRAGGVEP